MHWIERHILKQLAFSDGRRYMELKPDGVDGNLFQYHAKLLEKRGLLARSKGGYELTSKGKIFVADLSQVKHMNVRKLPRVVVMVICRNEKGEYLLFKWRRHPYRGFVSLPFGRQFYGEPLDWTAGEQLRLKSGYVGEVDYVGQAVSITEQANGGIVDHLAISIFEAHQPEFIGEPDGLTGKAYWGQANTVEADSAVVGFREIVNWYESKDRPLLLQIRCIASKNAA